MDTTTISAFDIAKLRKWIQEALKLPKEAVIGGWLPENPLSAFITMDVLNTNEIGQATREFDGKRERIRQSMQSTESYKLKAIFQSSAFLSFLKSNHWGVIRFSDVRNLTATVGADYEERGQFDVVFSHHHIVDTPLDPIERVEQRTNNKSQDIGA